MEKKRFTGKIPLALSVPGVLIAFGVALLVDGDFTFKGLPSIPKVEAQNFAGQPTFSFPFTVNQTAHAAAYYLALANRGQIGEMISYSWSAACATAANSATFILEGSNDNTNWFALATSEELDSTPGFGIVYNDGYWNFKRIAFPGCTAAETFTGVYVGYPVPIPITQTSETVVFAEVQANTGIGPVGYFLVQGLQCYNPNTARAYLIFGNLVWGVQPATEFQYQGAAFLEQGQVTQFGAFTTPTGGTPVSTPVECTFQLSGGPLYPVSPKL